ncbi:MAG: hypothetical protein JWP88_2117 [Flaviaesturariibacter sp.]|nr:hypothetical protein [Flaviaesturariibacter sp.]
MKTLFTRFLFIMLGLGLLLPEANAIVPTKPPVSGTPDAATVKEALKSFQHLSAKEKKVKMKEVKKAVKAFKAEKRAKKGPVASQLIQIIFAILIPPLGVYLHEGEINKRFWIDLLLTLLFILPGIIYALVVVLDAA